MYTIYRHLIIKERIFRLLMSINVIAGYSATLKMPDRCKLTKHYIETAL